MSLLESIAVVINLLGVWLTARRIRWCWPVGIVAVARKLVIALWRYVDQGIVPAGAELKPPA